jgi:hypothetical protein
VFKRNYFSLLIFLLMASVTLTACDSNEAEDTVAVVEEPEVTETVVTVAADAPIVQETVAAIASDPDLSSAVAAVAGAGVTVVVSTDPGAVVQTTSTVSAVAGQATPPAVTTTIAPLVNQATGQPIAAAAVVSSSGGQTQTIIAAPNVANPAAIQIAATPSTGQATTTSLNSVFNPSGISSAATSTASQAFVSRRTRLLQAGQSFAWRTAADGQTFAARIQDALANGKRDDVTITLVDYQDKTYQAFRNSLSRASSACSSSGGSAILQADVTVRTGADGSGTAVVTFDCSVIRSIPPQVYNPG